LAIYTVRIKVRPRPARVTTRRRLRRQDRVYAQNAEKHLRLALNHDARIAPVDGTIDAARLIFGGDDALLAKANAVLAALQDALHQNLKIVKQ
jgi:hypothetical protein